MSIVDEKVNLESCEDSEKCIARFILSEHNEEEISQARSKNIFLEGKSQKERIQTLDESWFHEQRNLLWPSRTLMS